MRTRTWVIGMLTVAAWFMGGTFLARAGDEPYPLKAPLGLDEENFIIPKDNPITKAKVALGKQLYFDPRLSVDGTVSCATCHNPALGFSNGLPFGVGIKGQKGNRNTPTVINRIFSTLQFWDGRAASLEEQALGPIQNPIEMGFTLEGVVKRLNGIKGYREQFRKVFGTDVTADGIAKAIAAFERTLISGDSPFDRYEFGGDEKALSPAAKRGLEIFRGKGNCASCHAGPNFTDERFHNLGVGFDKPNPDLGRYNVTKKEEDKGAFKTPTLRDVALTAPYMHDGSLKTLEEVIEFYNKGGIKNPYLDKEIKPLNLTEQEKKDLVAFLKALTGRPIRVKAPELPK